MKPLVLLHGGAGSWRGKVDWDAIDRAILGCARHGFRELASGALTAVSTAVSCMEESGVFNAGVGAHPNAIGEVELDAGIMDGRGPRAGAVACVKNVPSPVRVARIVMEETPHVLLVCSYAERLAREHGLWRSLRSGEHGLGRGNSRSEGLDTVGAVAVDGTGSVAAATSTGGLPGKMPCRVGDSPIPGAGYYADDRLGAVSATGIGEKIMIKLASYEVARRLSDLKPSEAAQIVAELMEDEFGSGNTGLIAVSMRGAGVGLNAKVMPIAAVHADGEFSRLVEEGDVEIVNGRLDLY